MIRLKIDDFYNGQPFPDMAGHIYMFYDDGGKLLYIGQSSDTTQRLPAHLGMTSRSGPSPIGRVVIRNLPNSLTWTVTVYDLSECKDLLPDSVTSQWVDEIWQRGFDRGDRRAVERALIEHLHPSVNATHSNTTNDLARRQKVGTRQGAVLLSYKRSGRAIRQFYPFALADVPGAALVDAHNSTARKPTAVYDFDLTGLADAWLGQMNE